MITVILHYAVVNTIRNNEYVVNKMIDNDNNEY